MLGPSRALCRGRLQVLVQQVLELQVLEQFQVLEQQVLALLLLELAQGLVDQVVLEQE